jgi:flagellar biosynthesis protein FliR
MSDIMGIENIEVMLLVFVRMTGLFVITPLFGRRNIPVYLKVGFSFMMAIILVNVVPVNSPIYNSTWEYILIVTKEFVTGITIGYIAYLVFAAVYMAGQLIDMQIGFGMVNIFDPLSNIQIPVTANFYFIVSMLILIGIKGHHTIIKALFESYNTVPLGMAVFGQKLADDIIRIFASMFFIGFKIAAPVTAAILVTDVGLGVLSRTVPQLNVFVIGMPLKITIGIVVLLITVPAFMILVQSLFGIMKGETLEFIKEIGSG